MVLLHVPGAPRLLPLTLSGYYCMMACNTQQHEGVKGMTIHYAVISAISAAALLILGFVIIRSDLTTVRIRRFFGLAILAAIIVIAAEAAASCFESAAASIRVPSLISNILGFSISPFIPLFIGYAISSDRKKGDIFFWIPTAVNFFLSVLSAAYPLIFGINTANTYYRGDFFWIYVAAYAASLAFLFVRTLALANRYQNKNHPVIFALFLFVVLGTAIQVVFPHLRVSWICVSIAICLYYAYCCELYYQVDGLTGLLGRRAYENYVCRLKGLPGAAILIIDIDDFKLVNDRCGHQFGDNCLIQISACVKDVFFKIGICFRIGGDEFCVISTNADSALIQNACWQFISGFDEIRKTEKQFPMVSLGCAYYEKGKGSVEEAIFAADQEMYYYKHHRKEGNPISSASPGNFTVV
jgi:diguanylate cyclase (GGDEF)-like protein